MDEPTTQPSRPVSELSVRELERLLEQLGEEERRISRRRASLHERIDWLRGGGAGFSPETEEQIATLIASERTISDERKALHQRIDALGHELERRTRAA
jgi:predicted  nucleic acid-binding Zn-ribbon protein